MLKKFFKASLAVLAIAIAVTAFNGLSFQKRINNRPLPSFYKKGVFHLHSNFSDGIGGIEEICRDAGAQNLDFVILTDHGRPNLQASAATAWLHDTLLIGASEFSLHSGHLAAAGYRTPDYIFPPEPQEAIAEVNRDQGVTFISHPLDRKIPWTDWQVSDFTGIEILSMYQMARKNLLYGLTLFPLQYMLNPDYALTSLISYPRKELEIWDGFNIEGKYYGIYALDTHAKLPISEKTSLHFPSYGATFKILRIYVKVDRELEKDAKTAAATIISSLRRGDFFCVIESLAAANGFENYYLEKDGRRVEMGGDAKADGGVLVLKLPFNFSTDILIKKDGGEFKKIPDNIRQEIAIPINRPGVYRCEISPHSGPGSDLPWILGNPIFIGRSRDPEKAKTVTPRRILAGSENYFQIEKNPLSQATMQVDTQATDQPVTRFTFILRQESPAQVDFWTALARRENLDFSNYRGFVFETRGSRPMRFWLQFRNGEDRLESAFQHSFLVGENWQRIAIPFARFHRLYGPNATPDLKKISAFFFTIDNGNSHSGSGGEISLRSIGLY
ncbi:MAG: hypothetical protein ABII93_06815 [Chrysiogenia bacterium]